MGPNPMRLAAAFAAAAAAVAVATAQQEADRGAASGDDEEGEEDCDVTLAFDHRSWLNIPALRAAVQAWKRFLVEALHTGDVACALRIARVAPLARALSLGERFLRGAFAGYASVMAWWLELHSDDRWSEAPSLDGFLASGCKRLEVLGDDVDWDFEWRALNWLPAYGGASKEDPLLTAAVELGRSCTAKASGASRDATVEEAPWRHLTTAVDSLLRGASSALESAQTAEKLTPALLAHVLRAEKAPALCGPSEDIAVDLVSLSPKQPHTNEKLTVQVMGKVPPTAEIQETRPKGEVRGSWDAEHTTLTIEGPHESQIAQKWGTRLRARKMLL
ncbi:unnamed protein product [Symbiodinium sp. CCMP2592]|nr:unnamed protein product [Symbiodinium sp. CCMP2592]